VPYNSRPEIIPDIQLNPMGSVLDSTLSGWSGFVDFALQFSFMEVMPSYDAA
jgi:hypothetical protein